MHLLSWTILEKWGMSDILTTKNVHGAKKDVNHCSITAPEINSLPVTHGQSTALAVRTSGIVL